ncbi:12099_t:CDS:2, partial [Entrophospora sp. SA101]
TNKLSISSAWRKSDEKGQGHKPDFLVAVDISGDIKYEILFGLFKPPFKTSTLINVDLVDLAVMMKDSLDMAYLKYRFELDLTVFGIHGFGYNVRIYVMDLVYDGIYRMYLLGEFELPRSNLSLSLVEYCICEMKNLKDLVDENIKRVPPFLLLQTGDQTPTMWASMTRKTLATPKKVEV